MDVIFKEIVQPRLKDLPIETAQGISGILRLFSTWSVFPKTALFLGQGNILPKVAEVLAPPKSKDEVKLFALGIIRNIVKLATDDTTATAANELLTQNMDHFLIHIGGVLRSDLSKDLLEGCVDTVSELASFVTTSTQVCFSFVGNELFNFFEVNERLLTLISGKESRRCLHILIRSTIEAGQS